MRKRFNERLSILEGTLCGIAASSNSDATALLRQCELLLEVLDGQEPEDEEAKREMALRTIYAIEHGLFQPPEPLPQQNDDRARAISARLRAHINGSTSESTLSIPAADMEALRLRYPAPVPESFLE